MKKSSGNIIRRYAKALFESAHSQEKVQLVSEEAQNWAEVFKPDMISFFVNPGVSQAIKKEMLREICDAQASTELLRNFFHMLVDNDRFVFVAEILHDVVKKCDEFLQIARIEMVTASPLSPEEGEGFRAALADSLKKQVVLSFKVDASLRAGCIVKIANTLVDASLRSRLQSLKESLSQGV